MPKFRVRAVNRSGSRIVTTLSAKDAAAVKLSLSDRGWTLLSVKKVFETGIRERHLNRCSNKSGVFLFRQLAELLNVGVPMNVALEEVLRLSPGGPLSQAWGQVLRSVSQGESLVEALASCKGLLAARHLAALNAGHTQKDISNALMGISEELEWRSEVIQRWRQACAYPVFAIGLLALVCGFLLTTVVPSLKPMLEPVASSLPWVTQQIIQLSDQANSLSHLLLMILKLSFLVFSIVAILLCLYKSSKRLQHFLVPTLFGNVSPSGLKTKGCLKKLCVQTLKFRVCTHHSFV